MNRNYSVYKPQFGKVSGYQPQRVSGSQIQNVRKYSMQIVIFYIFYHDFSREYFQFVQPAHQQGQQQVIYGNQQQQPMYGQQEQQQGVPYQVYGNQQPQYQASRIHFIFLICVFISKTNFFFQSYFIS